MSDTLVGVSVMRYWRSEAKLSERQDKLHFNLVAVRKRIADLPLALTGKELYKEEKRIEGKLAHAVCERADLVQFAVEVKRTACARLRVGASGRERDATWSRRPRTLL